MSDPMTAHDRLRQELIDFDVFKVWSVLVTIFGDLAPGANDVIRGTDLSALTSRMRIKPEALRVAIHRLKNDGWITAQKSGRVSLYQLSPYGRSETQSARARVYDAPDTALTDWYVVLTETGEPPAQTRAWTKIRPGTYLVNGAPAPAPGLVVSQLVEGMLPPWVLDAICPKEVQHTHARLATLLSGFDARHIPPAPVDQLTLRLLILHAWRRLVLRHDLSVFGSITADWPAANAGQHVRAALAHLPRQPLDTI